MTDTNSSTDAPTVNADSQLIDLGHTQIAYQQRGSGPDLMFIHGWPLHGGTWDPVVDILQSDFTCHTFDLPGAGRSQTTDASPVAFTDMAVTVTEIVDHVGLDRFGLVGHNSGGLIARFVAAERSEAVTSLVLAGSEIPGHHSWQVAVFQFVRDLPGGAEIFRQFLSTPALVESPLALGGLFADLERIRPGFAEIMGLLLSDDDVLNQQLKVLAALTPEMTDALFEVHPQLDMPTLLLWGEDDGFFPVEKARAMAKQFAGPTRFEVIPDAMLLVHEEHPERFAALMAEFLAALQPAA